MANNVIIKTLKVIYQYKMALLFLALWAHVSLLNLFYVNYKGPVFLWQENSEPLTIQVHFLIALLATGFYLAISKLRQIDSDKKVRITDKFWLVCSLVLVLSIGFLLI
ncbi:hypothetical protein [Cognaticolwellia mytili]|uniref:hypothetical protein n=1 Tax=Cognaticolwellia mytili TaxID=1888913 RepID=UPI000A16FF57|nr:hypothetical protein [Cognaticolwellia mytili]